ncbi:MAG: peptidoglycan bridge formation glycyltransferase FemA/FemB family protein [Bacteroidia bacterium]
MKIITDINDPVFEVCSKGNWPLFFTKQSHLYLKNLGQDLALAFSPENKIVLSFRIWRSRFLKLVTCNYQPLRNGLPITVEEEKEFLKEFIIKVKRDNICDRITASDNTAVFQALPNEAVGVPFGTYKISLEGKTYEELLLSFQARYRSAIRQAAAIPIKIVYGEQALNDFYKLHVFTMQRSGQHVQTLGYFKNYFNSFPKNTMMSVAYHNETPVGALLLVYTQHSAQYLYGCSSDDTKASGSIKFLHADAMKQLMNKGVKEYDFVGARLSKITDSKLQGIQDFKSRFGTTLYKGYMWKKDIHPLKCKTFDLLLKTKLKITNQPYPLDIIDQELRKQQTNTSKEIFNAFKIGTIKRTLKKTISKKELTKQLEKAGLNKGDNILVHSSLSKIGNVEGGALTIINSLMETIGENGTMVMPTFSYVNTMLHTTQVKEYLFDPQKTPSVVGIISETFRNLPGIQRSLHPTHSLAALGPLAKKITADHFSIETNFGPGSPFDKLRMFKGKLVGIGITIGPTTFYHSLEDHFPNEFKNAYLPDPFPLKVKTPSGITEKNIFIHNPEFHVNRIDKKPEIEKWFTSHFTKKNILHSSPLGNSIVWWMDLEQLFNELIELKKKNITIYKVPESEVN